MDRLKELEESFWKYNSHPSQHSASLGYLADTIKSDVDDVIANSDLSSAEKLSLLRAYNNLYARTTSVMDQEYAEQEGRSACGEVLFRTEADLLAAIGKFPSV